MPAYTPNASAFITNLRLLDLDQCLDWPAITARVLTAKEAQQDQKHRIRCVEWALYRLFEIWDVEETKKRLQPFFPPLAPLQSLNLRAALYRCLNELKKNGVLGRDVTIRKTMLDDCKGEKLEEVLVSFSTIVLQKILAAEKGKASTVSKRLGLASKLSQTEQRSLLPLAIAHWASLSTLLRHKEHMRKHYDGCQKVLDERRLCFSQRKARLEANSESSARAPVPTEILEKAKKKVGLHWHGNSQWLDVLLEGDRSIVHDSRPGTSFEQTWNGVLDGTTVAEAKAHDRGLLQDLENRVATQKNRLRRWKEFRDELAKEHETKAANSDSNTALKLGGDIGISFADHQDLVVDPKAFSVRKYSQMGDVSVLAEVDDYQKLVDSLGRELHDVDEPKDRDYGSTTEYLQQPDREATPEPKDHFTIGVGLPAAQGSKSDTKKGEESQGLVQKPKVVETPSMSVVQDRRPDGQWFGKPQYRHQESSYSTQPVKAESSPMAYTVSSRATTDLISRENDTPSTEYDEEDLLAAEIVALTMNAEPSPIKGKPSLAERTRQSMAFTSSRDPPPPDESTMQPPFPRASRPKKSSRPSIEADVKSTLLERTRQSMSVLPTGPRKAEHKHRASQRFPTNQFGTPVKATARPIASLQETPPEQLLSGDVDYASVFKSRPKIAMSPTPSPLPGNASSAETSLLEGW